MNMPVIKTADIETAPLIMAGWGLFDQNFGLSQIIKDQSILSYSIKTLHKRGVRYEDVSDKADYGDDFDLCLKLWHELDEADFIIAHNGKRFDEKKMNARFIKHKLPPPSPFVVIDTLLAVRAVAGFTSNKLEYLTKSLCTGAVKMSHGKFPGYLLWQQCLLGNPAAWKEMKKYNVLDVKSLEELYLLIRPWMKNHPNLTTFVDDDKPRCPKCFSAKVVEKGHRHTTVGRYVRYQCQECMSWSRGRYSVRPKEASKTLLVN